MALFHTEHFAESQPLNSLVAANLLARKTRTAISCLAVGVGVMLLVVLAGMTRGSLREIAERMQRADAEMIVHSRKSNIIFETTTPLEEDYRELLLAVEGVERVAPVVTNRAVINSKGHNVFGIDPADFPQVTRGARITRGRLFSGSHEMVVDERLAAVDGIEVGDRLDCLGDSFEIVGVCEAMPVRLAVPKETLQELGHSGRRVTFFFLKTAPGQDATEVAKRIEIEMPTLKTLMLGNYMQTLESNFKLMNDVILAVIAVGGFVSFLVILLTMYTSVVERTREIGVLKALGATRRYIIRQVVLESLVISGIGAAAGIALSFCARSVIMTQWPLLTVDLTPKWISLGCLLGLLGGTLGALYPAWLAARQDPEVSLNYY